MPNVRLLQMKLVAFSAVLLPLALTAPSEGFAEAYVHELVKEKARECGEIAIRILRHPEEFQTEVARENALSRAVSVVSVYERMAKSIKDPKELEAIDARIQECKGVITKALSGGR